MARRSSKPRIAYPTKRSALPESANAYDYTALAPGISLGYCRRKGAGRWQIRVADGNGGSWFKIIGIADDNEPADNEHIFDWGQAVARALRLARGQDETATEAPATVDTALADYEANLTAEGRDPTNATRIRYHVTPAILAKPVAMLTDRDLRRWRNGLIEAGANRATLVTLGATLTVAARPLVR